MPGAFKVRRRRVDTCIDGQTLGSDAAPRLALMTPSHDDESPKGATLFAHSVEQGYRLQPPVLLMTVFLTAPIAIILHDSARGWWLAMWVALHLAISAVRFAVLRAYWRSTDRLSHPDRWMQLFCLGYIASGLTWSAMGTVFYPRAGQWEVGLVGLITAAVASIGMTSVGPLHRAYQWFLLAFLAPVAWYKISLGTWDETALGAASLVYAGAMIVVSRRTSGNAIEMLRAQRESEQLAQRLELAMEETWRKNAELEQEVAKRERARAHAEAANRAKSQFLANMSHEIRTPLNGVVGMLELLSDSQLTPHQAKLARTASQSSEALLAVISNILDISRIEANRIDLETLPFDFGQLANDTIALLSGNAERKGITLSCQVDERLPTALLGDPNRIRQVMLNLVGNAIKFTERGSVDVSVRCDPRNDNTSVSVRFSVRDTGIGLSTHEIDRLFQPFSQADMSTSRRYGGTGLGLAISRSLIELMGGTMSVTSESAIGSIFSFELQLAPASIGLGSHTAPQPIVHAEQTSQRNSDDVSDDLFIISDSHSASATSPAVHVRTHFAGTRVLVVEDNAVNREVARAMLSAIGCDVSLANGGPQGVAMAMAEHFDLVLMDCQMPVIDGFEATRQIRDAQVGSTPVPIIALTANALQGDRERCLVAGMDDYLTKPFSRTALQQILNKWAPAKPEVRPVETPTLDVLERSALDDIRTMDATGSLLQEIVSLYYADGNRLVGEVRSAHATGNAAALAFSAHTLKSASGCVGAKEVATQCAAIEAFAKNTSTVSAATDIDALEIAYTRARAALIAATGIFPVDVAEAHSTPHTVLTAGAA